MSRVSGAALETTLDPILRGRLVLEQPRRGYRFNIDAILLARFAGAVDVVPGRVVDLGAGCGIVGLLLARQWAGARVILVERQPALAWLAQRNVQHNALEMRVEVRCEDLRELGWRASDVSLERRGGPTLAVINPPFFVPQRGRVSPDTMIAQAKHELAGSLAELLAAVGAGLAEGDVLTLIHDAGRLAELQGLLPAHGLELETLRCVHPLPGAPPRRVLLRARRCREPRAAVGCEGPPLVLHEAPGSPTAELASILGDDQA